MSWDLPRGEEFLPHTSPSELKQLMAAQTKARPRLWLLIAWHRKKGESVDSIAEACAVPKSTADTVLHRFAERGLTAAQPVKQEGRPPLLTLRQRKRLLTELEKGPSHNPSGLWTTKEVRELIRKRFGVAYAPQHVWRILVACGFSLQKPRLHHYKAASLEEQEAFKKKRGVWPRSTARKVLLWPAKTRPRSVSSPASRKAGRAGEASRSR